MTRSSGGLAQAEGRGRELPMGGNVQHLKVVVADDWVVIGSHNWTDRALSQNDEISIAIRDPVTADVAYHDILNVARGLRVG